MSDTNSTNGTNEEQTAQEQQVEETKTKEEQVQKGEKKKFAYRFPSLGVAVEAESREQANEKVKETKEYKKFTFTKKPTKKS